MMLSRQLEINRFESSFSKSSRSPKLSKVEQIYVKQPGNESVLLGPFSVQCPENPNSLDKHLLEEGISSLSNSNGTSKFLFSDDCELNAPLDLDYDGRFETSIYNSGNLGNVTNSIFPSITHVSMEYSIPRLSYSVAVGGLFKVVDLFIRSYPLNLSFIVPKLGDFPNNELAPPMRRFHVTVLGSWLPIDLHILHENINGISRVFFLISCSLFHKRTSATLYKCADENEEIVFYSLWNQAVGYVLSIYTPSICHFHDYHGCLAPLYLLPDSFEAIKICITLHNGDFQGCWRIRNDHHLKWILSAFDIGFDMFLFFCEHSGTFNILSASIKFISLKQAGEGIVSVSPRYAERLQKKHSLFWGLKKIQGILNAVNESEKPFFDLRRMNAWKEEGKRLVQQKYGLLTRCPYNDCMGGNNARNFPSIQPQNWKNQSLPFEPCIACRSQLVVFLGRQSFQKGSDLIAAAAEKILLKHERLQMIILGPCTDQEGDDSLQEMTRVMNNYPSRMYVEDRIVYSAEKQLLMRAADFVLLPSRFEPCGLVDIEFGWRGALGIGFDQGGLGKMPGFFESLSSSAIDHQQDRLQRAFDSALSASPEKIERMRAAAISASFPPEEMFDKYTCLYMEIHHMKTEKTISFEKIVHVTPPIPPSRASEMQKIQNECDALLDDSKSIIDHLNINDNLRKDNFKEENDDNMLIKRKKEAHAHTIRIHEGIIFVAYILNFIPGFLVILSASSWWWRDDSNFSTLDVPTSIFALYSSFYGIFSLFWSYIALRFRPLDLFRIGLIGQSISISFFCLIGNDIRCLIFATIVSSFFAAEAAPVMIGLNFLEDSPGQVSIGKRMGIAESLRNTSHAMIGLLMTYAMNQKESIASHLLSNFSVAFSLLFFCMSIPFFISVPSIYKTRLLPYRGQFQMLVHRNTLWLILHSSLCEGLAMGSIAMFLVWTIAAGWKTSQASLSILCFYGSSAVASLLGGCIFERVRKAWPIQAPLYSLLLPPSPPLLALTWFIFGKTHLFTILFLMIVSSIPSIARNFSINYLLLQTLSREHFVLALGLRGLYGGIAAAIAPNLVRFLVRGNDALAFGFLPSQTDLASAIVIVASLAGGLEYFISLFCFKTFPEESMDIP